MEPFRRFQASLTAAHHILQIACSNLGEAATDGIFLGSCLMDCPGTGVVMKSLQQNLLSSSCVIKGPIRRLQDRMDSPPPWTSGGKKMIRQQN